MGEAPTTQLKIQSQKAVSTTALRSTAKPTEAVTMKLKQSIDTLHLKAEPTKSKAGSASTDDAHFQRKFSAHKMKVSLSTYDKSLVLGCAVVVGIVFAAFVARFVQRSRAQVSAELAYESGLE